MAVPKSGTALQRGCDDEVSSERKEYSVSSTVKENCNTWVRKGMKEPSFSPLALVLWQYSAHPLSSLKSNSTERKIALTLCFLSALSSSTKKITTMSWMEKAMATHSSTLVWKIPWMEEPGRVQSMGLLRVGHDWATSLSLFTFMH